MSDSDLENFLGLPLGTLDSITGGDATEGSAITQTFHANIGDLIVFGYNFLTDETPGSQFSDEAFVSLNSEALSFDGHFPFTTYQPSFTLFDQETGFKTFAISIKKAGLNTIGFGVFDFKDTMTNSAIIQDKITFTSSVPAPSTTWLFGTGLLAIMVWRWKDLPVTQTIETHAVSKNPVRGDYRNRAADSSCVDKQPSSQRCQNARF